MVVILRSPQPSRTPRRPRSVASLAALPLLLLAGCSGAVEVSAPSIEGADLTACEALVDDVPDQLFAQDRRDVDGASNTAAAWGEPAIVLECGAKAPEEFDAFSRCSEYAGVGWFMPDAALKNADRTLVITVQSHSPRISVTIPSEFRQHSPDTQLQTLGALVTEHLTEVQPCT